MVGIIADFHAWDYSGAHTEAAYLTFSYTPTVVKLKSFAATGNGNQVKVEWKTGYEVDNLGFNLYREENGKVFRLTPSLIAGSALLAGVGTPLTAGHSYTWWDDLATESREASVVSHQSSVVTPPPSPSPSRGEAVRPTPNAQRRTDLRTHSALSTVQYWLEDVDLHGKHTWHGPVEVKLSPPSGQASVSLASQLSDHGPGPGVCPLKQARKGTGYRWK